MKPTTDASPSVRAAYLQMVKERAEVTAATGIEFDDDGRMILRCHKCAAVVTGETQGTVIRNIGRHVYAVHRPKLRLVAS